MGGIFITDQIYIRRLLKKIAVKRFMDNFNKKIAELNISHLELSLKAGKPENAFNKTLNEAEDPQLSSFLKYWHAALQILKENAINTEKLNFCSLIDKDIEKLLEAAAEISEADAVNYLKKEMEFFIGLEVYVQLLKSKKAVTDEELQAYSNIKKILLGRD